MYSHYLDYLPAVLSSDLLLDVVELHLHGLRSLPQLFGYLVERPPFKIQFGDILFCRGESDHTLRLADHVLVRAELSPERAAYLLEVEDVMFDVRSQQVMLPEVAADEPVNDVESSDVLLCGGIRLGLIQQP